MADVDFGEPEFVSAAQVYGRFARIFNDLGEEFVDHNEVTWSEIDLVQATARQPGARAWYLLDEEALDERVRERSVREIVAEAPTRTEPTDLPFAAPDARLSLFASPPRSRTRSEACASTSGRECWTARALR